MRDVAPTHQPGAPLIGEKIFLFQRTFLACSQRATAGCSDSSRRPTSPVRTPRLTRPGQSGRRCGSAHPSATNPGCHSTPAAYTVDPWAKVVTIQTLASVRTTGGEVSPSTSPERPSCWQTQTHVPPPRITIPPSLIWCCSLHIDLTSAGCPSLSCRPVHSETAGLDIRLAVRHVRASQSLVGHDWINIIRSPSALPIHSLCHNPPFFYRLLVCNPASERP